MHSDPTNEKRFPSGEEAILDAAITLFAEKGFDAVSMSAISSLANTSKPNIYHHFGSKKGLYLAVMKDAAQRGIELLDSLAETPGTVKQRLAGFAVGELKNTIKHKRSSQLILREALSGGTDRGREVVEQAFNGMFSRLVGMVHDGQQKSEFRDDVDPALIAFIVVATNMFYFQAAPYLQYVQDAGFAEIPEEYSSNVMDILFNGILREGANKP